MKKQQKAYLFALLAVLAWSTVASAFKICLRHMDFVQMLFWSTLISLSALLSILLLQKKIHLLKQSSTHELIRSAALGFVNPFFYYMILFRAYSLLPAQEAQPLNYTWPIVVVLLSAPLLKQKVTILNLLGIFLSFSGVIVISTRGDLFGLQFSNPVGVGLALGSSIIWALFWLLNVRDGRDEVIKLFLNFASGFVFISIYIILFDEFRIPGAGGILSVAYIGLFEMGITFVFWMKALKNSSSSAKVSNMIYISPFLSLFLIHIIVGETIMLSSVWGLALIVSGIIIQNLRKRKD